MNVQKEIFLIMKLLIRTDFVKNLNIKITH